MLTQASKPATEDAVAALPEPLMTTPQAAKYLSLGASTLEQLRTKGGGPRYLKLTSHAVRYRRVDLDNWVAERVTANTSERRVG